MMPRVIEIVVSAGRTFNHPYESYSNLKPHVSLKAALDDGEDYVRSVKDLQAQAEMLVEDHKQHMIRSLMEMEIMQRRDAEASSLARNIAECQQRLDRLREGHVPAIEVDENEKAPF
jgi:hypothetical protein